MPSYDTINIWVKSIFQPELLQSTDFQHRTTKLDILHQPTIKTVQITPLELKPLSFGPCHLSDMAPVATSVFLHLPARKRRWWSERRSLRAAVGEGGAGRSEHAGGWVGFGGARGQVGAPGRTRQQ
jgi:hypothetical protein